jgi:peptidyl-prolyl cis-trans isomerase C/peptidyl-prolyl cis-trans isomerase D
MKYLVFVLSFVSVLAWAQQKDAVVAEVGAKKITLDEFNKKYNEILSVVGTAGGTAPSKQEFLEDLVRFEMGLQEANKKNMQKDPLYQERIQQELYKILLEREIGPKAAKIQPTDAEMKSWYSKNPSIRWSNILIELKANATPEQRAEAKKRAQEIFAEVKSSKRPFEELVRLYSDDTMAKQFGGDAGWQSVVTAPLIYEDVKNAKVGDLVGPIETLFGYMILKITGRASYDQANHAQVRQAVFNEKRKQLMDQYFAGLKKEISVKTNPGLLK